MFINNCTIALCKMQNDYSCMKITFQLCFLHDQIFVFSWEVCRGNMICDWIFINLICCESSLRWHLNAMARQLTIISNPRLELNLTTLPCWTHCARRAILPHSTRVFYLLCLDQADTGNFIQITRIFVVRTVFVFQYVILAVYLMLQFHLILGVSFRRYLFFCC